MGGRRYRSGLEAPSLLFVTTSTIKRINLFNCDEKLSLAEQTLFDVVKMHSCFLMGYVLMPNHVHLLIGTRQGGNHISTFMHSFKGNVRKAIADDRRIWQRRFDDLAIMTEKQFSIKLDYIHWNPVKRGLVDRPEDWGYSSYRYWAFREENPFLVKDFTWLD
jgi:putative transposase